MNTKKLKNRVEEKVNVLDNYQNITVELVQKIGYELSFGVIFDLESQSERIADDFESKKINVVEFLDLSIKSHKAAIKKLNKIDF